MLRTDTNIETEWLVKSLVIVPFHQLFLLLLLFRCQFVISTYNWPNTDKVLGGWNKTMQSLLHIPITPAFVEYLCPFRDISAIIWYPWHKLNLPRALPTYSCNLHLKCKHNTTSVHLDIFFLSNQGLGTFVLMQYASQPFYDVSPESYTHLENIITELCTYLSHKNYCQGKV